MLGGSFFATPDLDGAGLVGEALDVSPVLAGTLLIGPAPAGRVPVGGTLVLEAAGAALGAVDPVAGRVVGLGVGLAAPSLVAGRSDGAFTPFVIGLEGAVGRLMGGTLADGTAAADGLAAVVFLAGVGVGLAEAGRDVELVVLGAAAALDVVVVGRDAAGLAVPEAGRDEAGAGLADAVAGLEDPVAGLDEAVAGLDGAVEGLDEAAVALDVAVVGLEVVAVLVAVLVGLGAIVDFGAVAVGFALAIAVDGFGALVAVLGDDGAGLDAVLDVVDVGFVAGLGPVPAGFTPAVLEALPAGLAGLGRLAVDDCILDVGALEAIGPLDVVLFPSLEFFSLAAASDPFSWASFPCKDGDLVLVGVAGITLTSGTFIVSRLASV